MDKGGHTMNIVYMDGKKRAVHSFEYRGGMCWSTTPHNNKDNQKTV